MISSVRIYRERQSRSRYFKALFLVLLFALSGLGFDAISGADVNTNQRIGMEEAMYILQRAAGVR